MKSKGLFLCVSVPRCLRCYYFTPSPAREVAPGVFHGRGARTPPLRLSAEFHEKMNQIAELENEKAKLENRNSNIEIRK